MKLVLSLTLATLASPALAHGDTPIHPESPAFLLAGLVVISAAALLARRKARTCPIRKQP